MIHQVQLWVNFLSFYDCLYDIKRSYTSPSPHIVSNALCGSSPKYMSLKNNQRNSLLEFEIGTETAVFGCITSRFGGNQL